VPTEHHRDPDEVRRRIAGHRFWWHQIDVGDGIVTPGQDNSQLKLSVLELPADLTGKTVLDMGAWDGFFSFEAERRGASRVVATDHFVWNDPEAGDCGFEIAHWALGSRVEKRRLRVEDLSPETVGTFDVVLFLGVLYHAQDPMRYLRIVRSVCRGMAVVETHVDGLDYPRPMMVFYPGATLSNDPTNFWGPNRLAVEAMLVEVGFSRAEYVTTWWMGTRMVFHAFV